MACYASIHSGWDYTYYLGSAAKGGGAYYLSATVETGEPPGVWVGRACAPMGMPRGSEVEPEIMKALYGQMTDPFTGEPLGKPPRKYKSIDERLAELLGKEPDATPERRAQLEIKAREAARHAVMYHDITFSFDKTISILHASLEAAAAREEKAGNADAAREYKTQADFVEYAVRRGAQAGLEYAQDEAGFSRAGYHGSVPKDEWGRPLAPAAAGRYVDAHEWIAAAFFQRTSRDGDPQLHVHTPVLNRVRTQGDDGRPVWRTLDGRALYRQRPAMSAVAARVTQELIADRLLAKFEARPDGKGHELAGITREAVGLFSSRRAVVTEGVAALAAEYEQQRGRPPSARALFQMAQFVTLNSRRRKPKMANAPTRAEMLDQWTRETTDRELGTLAEYEAAVVGSRDPDEPRIEDVAAEDIERVITTALAEVQEAHSEWTRPQLLAALNNCLPTWTGVFRTGEVIRLLQDLADEAIAHGDVVCLESPDLVPSEGVRVRADGTPQWKVHGSERYAVRSQLDIEEQLSAAAKEPPPPPPSPPPADEAEAAEREAAEAAAAARRAALAAALGAAPAELDALPGRRPPQSSRAPGADEDDEDQAEPARRYAGLRQDQAAAVWGVMTGTRPVDVLIGPAGSGKSRTLGKMAELWGGYTGGRVIGVATAQVAAENLAAEMRGHAAAWNIARFLAAHARDVEDVQLSPADLLVVDEAGMVPTGDLAALHEIAATAGARVLLTGDPEQLPAVGAGGALAMLARDRGYWPLTRVTRMKAAWERAASVRVRAGDPDALIEYDKRGRILQGTREEMHAAAYRAFLADYIQGRETLLIVPTNAEAAELNARIRAHLADLGRVAELADIPLMDGTRAGTGDLIQARDPAYDITDAEGRELANRDVMEILTVDHEAEAAEVRRLLDTDDETGAREWTSPYTVPLSYLREYATLAYSGTIHSAQGRTVGTSHGIVDQTADRAAVYVPLSRATERNTLYVVVEARNPDTGPQGETTPGQKRAADMRPGTRTAPALTGPEAAGTDAAHREAETATPWSPGADKWTVLTGALEKGPENELTARDVQRDAAEAAGHTAILGAMWTDLAAEVCGERYDAAIREQLTATQWARYQAEDARPTLHRLLRAVELAGEDPIDIAATAIGRRELGERGEKYAADSISEVIHWRIMHPPKPGKPPNLTPKPEYSASWKARTPQAPDAERARRLTDLAERLDERQDELGRRTRLRPPPWALERFGPVPQDEPGAWRWAKRAAMVQAYREMFSQTDPHQALGREPRAPEARAMWRAAAQALGASREEIELERLTDGQLHAMRERYQREFAAAPPNVDAQLRSAEIRRQDHATAAVLARARERATAGPGRAEARATAGQHEHRAAELRTITGALTEINTQRERWTQATAEVRDRADAATAELQRRAPKGTKIPRYEDRRPEEIRLLETDAARLAAEHGQDPAAQTLTAAELQAAAARETLDRRENRLRAGNPARWPEAPNLGETRNLWPRPPAAAQPAAPEASASRPAGRLSPLMSEILGWFADPDPDAPAPEPASEPEQSEETTPDPAAAADPEPGPAGQMEPEADESLGRAILTDARPSWIAQRGGDQVPAADDMAALAPMVNYALRFMSADAVRDVITDRVASARDLQALVRWRLEGEIDAARNYDRYAAEAAREAEEADRLAEDREAARRAEAARAAERHAARLADETHPLRQIKDELARRAAEREAAALADQTRSRPDAAPSAPEPSAGPAPDPADPYAERLAEIRRLMAGTPEERSRARALAQVIFSQAARQTRNTGAEQEPEAGPAEEPDVEPAGRAAPETGPPTGPEPAPDQGGTPMTEYGNPQTEPGEPELPEYDPDLAYDQWMAQQEGIKGVVVDGRTPLPELDLSDPGEVPDDPEWQAEAEQRRADAEAGIVREQYPPDVDMSAIADALERSRADRPAEEPEPAADGGTEPEPSEDIEPEPEPEVNDPEPEPGPLAEKVAPGEDPAADVDREPEPEPAEDIEPAEEPEPAADVEAIRDAADAAGMAAAIADYRAAVVEADEAALDIEPAREADRGIDRDDPELDEPEV